MSRSTSGSITSSDLAKGKKFIKKLLYVQHVDEERDTVSEISNRYLEIYLLADRTNFHDSKFTKYLASPKANLGILKSSMKDVITEVTVYSNPLSIPFQLKDVTIHEYVVFMTENTSNGHLRKTWWSLEKNGKCIVMQQSTNKDDVINKIYDAEKGQSVERLGPIQKSKKKTFFLIFRQNFSDLMRIIVDTNKLNEPYHLVTSNCQHFTSFIIKELKQKWTAPTSTIVCVFKSSSYSTVIKSRIKSRFKLKNKKIQPGIKVDAFKYKSILNDEKFDCYWAMMEGRREDFDELINKFTIETLNSVDSQGYTLLQWATVYSTSDWPIDEELKEIGIGIPSDQGLFRRNVFFIALQYLSPNKKLLSLDGIDKKFDISGVNKTGDTALHLALYGEKWGIAEKILNRFKNYDVNRTNNREETPLHLAAKFNCGFGLFRKILNRSNSEYVNKVDGIGNTALHYAMLKKSEPAVKELLNRKDVDVDIKNYINKTPLHLASQWWYISADLFKMILEKSTDVINAQDKDGKTALHLAIGGQSEMKTNKLLKHNDVIVNVKNNNNETALHLASKWKDIPSDLFKLIKEKSTDINAQDHKGWTALHYAIIHKSEIATKELLAHNDVDVNVKDNNNETALKFAIRTWKNIPVDLFNLILQKSTDVINAQDNRGNTALHYAIDEKSEITTKALLAYSDVDVKVKNDYSETALHLASQWPNIPADLFKMILEKSTYVINAQDKDGKTALHLAVLFKSEIAVKGLLAHNDVDVNIQNNRNATALIYVSYFWKDIPSHLFKLILERKANDEVEKISKMDRLFKYLRNLTVHK
jgi:ankyrin repeat protein